MAARTSAAAWAPSRAATIASCRLPAVEQRQQAAIQLAVQQGIERFRNQQRLPFADIAELQVRGKRGTLDRSPGPQQSSWSISRARDSSPPALASGLSAPDQPARSGARQQRVDVSGRAASRFR